MAAGVLDVAVDESLDTTQLALRDCTFTRTSTRFSGVCTHPEVDVINRVRVVRASQLEGKVIPQMRTPPGHLGVTLRALSQCPQEKTWSMSHLKPGDDLRGLSLFRPQAVIVIVIHWSRLPNLLEKEEEALGNPLAVVVLSRTV